MNIQENIYKAIYENCDEGIIVANKLGEITIANNSAHKIFGYEYGELSKINIEHLVPKNLRQNHQHDLGKYHKNPSPRKMGVGRDLLGLRKSGDLFPLEISLNTLTIGNEVHSMAFIIDISERKKMEKALQISEKQLILYAAELEERVKERTDQLDQSVLELERSNKELASQIEVRKNAEIKTKNALVKEKELSELKSRFVSMASHEFRTPLSTILSSASLIDKYKTEETFDKRSRHVKKIKTSIGNLNHILNDFLSLSKLEEGIVVVTFESMNLRELVDEVLEEMSIILKKGQQFINEFVGENPVIIMDRKILKNIFINLLSNAIKYSQENKKILLKINCSNENTVIIIKDEGVGISASDQKHLFQRFFRAQNVLNIQGTGLGLNIVKKYVEQLSGEIEFSSELEVGTTFTITLPIKKDE